MASLAAPAFMPPKTEILIRRNLVLSYYYKLAGSRNGWGSGVLGTRMELKFSEMKYLKQQFLVSGVSGVGLLALSLLVWISDKNNDYPSLQISIHLILALLAAFLFGLISLVTLFMKKRQSDFTCWHNFTGVLNLVLGVLLSLFLYTDGYSVLSSLYLWAVPPFILGILILQQVYTNKALRE
jgi:hypothetical protein